MSSDVNVRVVIRNGRERRLNVVPDGAQEQEAWDGDHQLVLNRKEQNLAHRLEELRKRPQLAAMMVPVARGLQETMILWGAWKSSVLDILEQLAEHDLFMRYQKLIEQDDASTRHRVRDLHDQLSTTMASWRSQSKSLQDERVQLVAGLQDRTVAETNAIRALEAQDTSKPIYRVLRNAVKAAENTALERLELQRKKGLVDLQSHFDILKGLQAGVRFIVSAFIKDALALQQQTDLTVKELNSSVRQKENSWALLCQKQYAEYYRGLHHPLTKLIHEIDPTATSSDLMQKTFDNENDPHCLRRCELALSLLREAQARLIGPKVSSAPPSDADEQLLKAYTERKAEEQREHQNYTERWLALQFEHAQRDRALRDAQARLQKLQEMAQQIQRGLQLTFQERDVDQKKLAVASRLAEQRLSQLREDMQQTTNVIAAEKQNLEQMQRNLSTRDRVSILRCILESTHQVYEVCLSMRNRFEAATQAEDMLRHMINEQFLKGVRELHQVAQGTVRRMMQVAHSHFAQVQVQLDRFQDASNEAGRRIDTLHRGRIAQEEQSTGQDLGTFRAIEEYADILVQRQAFQEALQKVENFRSIVDQAVTFIQSVQNAT